MPRACLAAVLALALTGGLLPARADPASLIQTLMVIDQGHFISFQWSFYFVDFPRTFVLKNDPAEKVALDDPATLEANLAKIVAAAFELKIDGQLVSPEKISRLTITPNQVCTVTMIYRGRPGASVELRAPVLQYLPPGAIINYEILPLNQARQLITGNLTAAPGPFAQAVTFREMGDGRSPAPGFESAAQALFKLGLRTAWSDANWLFLASVLVVALRARRAVTILAVMFLAWVAVWLVFGPEGTRLPWRIPGLAAGLAVALVAGAAARCAPSRVVLWLAAGTAFVTAASDLQQLSWFPEQKTVSAGLGLCAGFACGLVSIAVVLLLVVTECRKFHEFERTRAPKICWLVAVLALLLPLEKALFG
jgi:hypothetical protein